MAVGVRELYLKAMLCPRVCAGGWLLTANEAAAVGTAAAVFVVGVLLMFCSSMGLLGLLRKSWKILALLVVILVALMFALFAIMTISFVLGYQMPSLRDIVAASWTKGCAKPAEDTIGCLQAESVANDWCWDHGGLAVPGMFAKGDKDPACATDPVLNAATDHASQKAHLCSISCQMAMVATLEDTMAYVSIGCYIAFFTLVLVVLWNSQTHHGLWCIQPSENEDDDENTVMSIPPVMAYVAYFLNGCLGLLGLFVAIMAAYLLESPTSWSAMFAVALGAFYFIVAAVSCGAVAKDLHWLLRFCNIAYFASCLPLLILSLVAAVYSGRIENVYDFYSDNWCTVRGEMDIVNPEYCAKMSDATCKAKIVNDTADNLALVGWVILITLAAVACLIWFSTRLSRKFKFDDRQDFSDEIDYADDAEDDKGGDDDDGEEGGMNPVQIALLAAPWVIGIIATILVMTLGGDEVESPDCTLTGAKVDFNGTGMWGAATFTQAKLLDGMTMDVEYHYDEDLYPTGVLVETYEIHEFPVPESGDCSAVGDIYPSVAAGTYKSVSTKPEVGDTFATGSLFVEAGTDGVESMFYDGIVPEPPSTGTNPDVALIGQSAIQGRSFVLKATEDCVGTPDAANTASITTCNDVSLVDRDLCEDAGCTWVSTEPACGTISYSGSEWETLANFTSGPQTAGALFGKIRGGVLFSQVVTRGSESDTTIYIELEATEDWDDDDAADDVQLTPTDNGCTAAHGCATDDGCPFVSCGHKMHIHQRAIAPDTNSAEACNDYSVGGHFNIEAGVRADPTAAGADPVAVPATNVYACAAGALGSAARQADCETGDITGKFTDGGLNIGKPGNPSKYFFVDTFDKLHSVLLKGSGTDIGAKSVVMHDNAQGAARVACADIPIAYPWESLSNLG